MIIDDITFHP